METAEAEAAEKRSREALALSSVAEATKTINCSGWTKAAVQRSCCTPTAAVSPQLRYLLEMTR